MIQPITALLSITLKQHSKISNGYNHHGHGHGRRHYYIRYGSTCHDDLCGVRIHRVPRNPRLLIPLLLILIVQMQQISFS